MTLSSFDYAEENKLCQDLQSDDPCIINIDANLKDPRVCSLYAPDIYNRIHVKEVCITIVTLSSCYGTLLFYESHYHSSCLAAECTRFTISTLLLFLSSLLLILFSHL